MSRFIKVFTNQNERLLLNLDTVKTMRECRNAHSQAVQQLLLVQFVDGTEIFVKETISEVEGEVTVTDLRTEANACV